ncbi:MobP2 family relaxase [Siminovitchia sediminis]|uniref:MobP2 family relaxase n=1 Tax=Siminovitchia sediminis TaxID=1274353 RepID=A0ABW4KCX0_9BACI
MSTPAVVLKSKFVMPNAKDYNDYIKYIDRKDAKRNLEINPNSSKKDDFSLYHTYMEYMGDEKKQGALFTSDKDVLSEVEKKKLKENFKQAQENGSPLWQDVISFDNDWLEEQGLYNSETNTLQEYKIKSVVRSAVDEMLKREGMNESAVWSASIHYNTDNIHVHVATVEPNPTREKVRFFDKEHNEWKEQYKAKRKQSSLDRMKSTVANQILDRKHDFNKIDELIRGTVHYKKEEQIKLSADERTKELFMKAMLLLPNDLRQWKYGYQSINNARPYIDEIVEIYLDTYHKKEMKELNELLDKQVQISRRLFGEDSRHDQYKKTKLDDLKKRMGNAVLTEMRDIVTLERRNRFSSSNNQARKNTKTKPSMNHRKNEYFKRLNSSREIYFAVLRLKNAMRKTYHDYQRERHMDEYDRMMEGYD